MIKPPVVPIELADALIYEAKLALAECPVWEGRVACCARPKYIFDQRDIPKIDLVPKLDTTFFSEYETLRVKLPTVCQNCGRYKEFVAISRWRNWYFIDRLAIPCSVTGKHWKVIWYWVGDPVAHSDSPLNGWNPTPADPMFPVAENPKQKATEQWYLGYRRVAGIDVDGHLYLLCTATNDKIWITAEQVKSLLEFLSKNGHLLK